MQRVKSVSHSDPIPDMKAVGSLSEDPTNESSSWTPSRPKLPLPPSQYRLLRNVNEIQDVGNEIIETQGLRLEGIRTQIKEVSSNIIQKLKESAERASSKDFWSVLKKISTSLLSALSIAFGSTLIASGGGALIGGALITSGILSLLNFGMTEMSGWDFIAAQLSNENEEQRKKIAMILPAAVGILAAGITLVGSAYGIITGSIQLSKQALNIAGALAIFDGITTLGVGIETGRLQLIQADLVYDRALLTVHQKEFDSLTQMIEGVLTHVKSVEKSAKGTLKKMQSNIW